MGHFGICEAYILSVEEHNYRQEKKERMFLGASMFVWIIWKQRNGIVFDNATLNEQKWNISLESTLWSKVKESRVIC